MKSSLILCCFWAILCLNVAFAGKMKIHFSFITSKSGDSSVIGGIPIVDYALEEINNSTEILPNYELSYRNVEDSKCLSISALESFLDQFDNETNEEPTYLSVMCCGCSSATIPVAEISHHWNIPHISFASSDPSLNNRDRFKTFFRTLPCYVYVPPTIVTMMVEFGWTQLAVITQLESPFTTVTKDIETIFKSQGWKLYADSVFEVGNVINYEALLNWHTNDDYRIIMINTLEVHAYHIVCEAYKKYGEELLNQDIVLILHGRYTQEWWETAHDSIDSDCSRKEIMEALNYTLTLTPDTYDLMDDPEAKAVSGKTAPQIEHIYKNLLKSNGSYTPLNFYGNAYDAMWAIALGLDRADKKLQSENISVTSCDDYSGEYVTLDQFDYRNKKMGCLLRESFQELNFTGITGQVSFKPDGARPENVMRLRQHRITADQKNGGYAIHRPTVAQVINQDTYSFGVVTYNGEGQVVFENEESYATVWPNQNGIPPYDGSPINIIDPTPIGLTVVLYLFGTFGIVAAMVTLVFNIVFRRKRTMKLGSPNLNFLIIIGTIILYCSMFFYGISAFSFEDRMVETALCNMRIWFFSFGYTLCFAVILAKQWRVYYIFSNPSPSKIIIKDWMLLIIVASLVAFDMMVVMIGSVIPESRLQAELVVQDMLRKNKDGMNEVVYRFSCSNDNATAWIAVSFAYKALLQLGGIFMAFTTRKVTIKALNDSKENCTLIYINSIVLTVLVVAQLALQEHHDAYTSIFGLAVFVEASLFLFVVFIPKAILLYTDPDAKKVFTESLGATTQITITSKTTNHEQQVTAAGIKAKILELQKQLELLEETSKEN